MLLFGMFACFAFSIASASAEFIAGSTPPRAAIAIWLPIFVKTAPRFASFAPFSRLIVDHLLCPDIVFSARFYSVISLIISDTRLLDDVALAQAIFRHSPHVDARDNNNTVTNHRLPWFNHNFRQRPW